MAEPLVLGVSEIPISSANTTVEFRVRWLGLLIVRGQFADVCGTVCIPGGDVSRVSVDVQVATASVRTGIALRDRHLRGPNFFDATRHPLATFRGGSVHRWPSHVALPGSLSLRGVTHTEELSCELEPPTGDGATVLVRGSTVVRRASFGVGVVRGIRSLDPLFALIGDTVRVDVAVRVPREAIRQG
jgi:polyisoprenoid-binding protein YceI